MVGAVDGRVADDALLRSALAGLELGLHEGDYMPGVGQGVWDGGEDLVERDERDVDDREVDGVGQGRGGQGARVGPLERGDAGIATQGLGELSATHVESVDVARAALQQDVGEAARRGADIQRGHAARIDPERVEGRRELVAAPADVRLARLDPDDRGSDRPGRPACDRAVRCRRRRRAPCRPGPGPGPSLGVGEAAVHEELVETDLALPMRDGRAHRPIVAQPASRGLTAGRAPTVDQGWSAASFLDIDAKYGSPLIADRNLSCQMSTRWYLTCGRPWRRQYLLSPPGTRKSAT